MRQLLILTGVAVALLLVGCGGGNDSDTPTATLEPPATATAEAAATATVAPDTRRTGIAELDAVLDVLFAGDADAIRELVRFTPVPCELEPIGLDPQPTCRDDEPAGTPVDVFPHASCHGGFTRPERMSGVHTSLARPTGEVIAIYVAPETYWPWAEFVVVFGDDTVALVPGDVQAVSITDGHITGTHLGCSATLEEFIAFHRLEDSVLFIGSGGLTGIGGLDTALDALRLADAEALGQLIQFQPIACIATPQGIGAPPLCRSDEADGTLVDVLPVSTCELMYVRQDESDWVLDSLAEGELYAVYRDGDRYVAVLSNAMPAGRPATRVYIDERRIVEIDITCVLTPEEVLADIDPADILVAPDALSER